MDAGTLSIQPCIVVHDSPLVAQDLEGVLQDAHIADVRSYRSLDETEGAPCRLAIVAGHHDDVVAHPIVRDWIESGVPLLILNGRATGAGETGNIQSVAQPFRSEDIVAALRNLLRA